MLKEVFDGPLRHQIEIVNHGWSRMNPHEVYDRYMMAFSDNQKAIRAEEAALDAHNERNKGSGPFGAIG